MEVSRNRKPVLEAGGLALRRNSKFEKNLLSSKSPSSSFSSSVQNVKMIKEHALVFRIFSSCKHLVLFRYCGENKQNQCHSALLSNEVKDDLQQRTNWMRCLD